MQIEDITYQQDQRNRPGRLQLVETREQFYQSGAIAIVGTTCQINLPTPPVGFARRWEIAHGFLSVSASGDIYTVTRKVPDQTTGTTMILVFNVAMFGPVFPLFRNITTGITDVAYGPRLLVFRGLEPFWTTTDIINVRWDVALAAGQTCAVQGFYKDIPL
jgi:hypothetical protein